MSEEKSRVYLMIMFLTSFVLEQFSLWYTFANFMLFVFMSMPTRKKKKQNKHLAIIAYNNNDKSISIIQQINNFL